MGKVEGCSIFRVARFIYGNRISLIWHKLGVKNTAVTSVWFFRFFLWIIQSGMSVVSSRVRGCCFLLRCLLEQGLGRVLCVVSKGGSIVGVMTFLFWCRIYKKSSHMTSAHSTAIMIHYEISLWTKLIFKRILSRWLQSIRGPINLIVLCKLVYVNK